MLTYLQSSERKLGLAMEKDADGKLFSILNGQHFMERKDVASRKWLLCAGERVVLRDLDIYVTALSACLPAGFCQCVGGVGAKTVP